MELSTQDQELVSNARTLVGERKVSGGIVGEVGAVLLTNAGLMFDGISLDLWCGIGFCAEHSAVANMVSHCSETQIQTIVAVGVDDTGTIRILWPCGRCRQMLELVDSRNLKQTYVIISEEKKVRLEVLLPSNPQ